MINQHFDGTTIKSNLYVLIDSILLNDIVV